MEYLTKTILQIRGRVGLVVGGLQVLIMLVCLVLRLLIHAPWVVVGIVFVILSIAAAILVSWLAGYLANIPLQALGSAIGHVSPSQNVAAPKTEDLIIGREYVTTLAYQLYQIASLQDNKLIAEHRHEATQASTILEHVPLPLFVFNKEQAITFGNGAALTYCGIDSNTLFGKPFFDVVDLEFSSSFTLETWVQDCQDNKATDTAYWRQVRLQTKSEEPVSRRFDMVGYYNRDNPKGVEFIVTLFDRTEEYVATDQSLDFTALAVHELRTPLTIMRGYIEVFEDELEGKLDPEMTQFMHRMRGAAQQLATYVNNILNVAKIEEDQLALKLSEENWREIVKHAGNDMDLRASAVGKTVSYSIPKDLPTIAVDRLTIYEVLCNLLDNALKYSDKSTNIKVASVVTKDGLIETTIQDHGVGIPTSVIPDLFEKFHRNHRNKTRIGGAGLGLYLSKAIVNAHGGDIWVRSKEGEGTTVGFTLKPYAMVAGELGKGNNKDDMVRTAHGWIKNHSLYRR